jgi:hypothetical protein
MGQGQVRQEVRCWYRDQEALAEYGVEPSRPRRRPAAFDFFWDWDAGWTKPQRSWKDHRKTQYREIREEDKRDSTKYAEHAARSGREEIHCYKCNCKVCLEMRRTWRLRRRRWWVKELTRAKKLGDSWRAKDALRSIEYLDFLGNLGR